jgi:pyruvyltransferase
MKSSTKNLTFLFILNSSWLSSHNNLFWWHCKEGTNFGDELSRVVVEKIINKTVQYHSLEQETKTVLAIGSVLHYARNNDIIWGSGFRENPLQEKRFTCLDIRAVRGPITRKFLLDLNINCPEVYGDPALLLNDLFPEFKTSEKIFDYIIIPNLADIPYLITYKNVVLPTSPWQEIVKKINQSKLVISSSLHGIIVAESYGIPARLLKMTTHEPLLKYHDYYESTGRAKFKYATSVQEALIIGGELPGYINLIPLKESFPYDFYEE